MYLNSFLCARKGQKVLVSDARTTKLVAPFFHLFSKKIKLASWRKMSKPMQQSSTIVKMFDCIYSNDADEPFLCTYMFCSNATVLCSGVCPCPPPCECPQTTDHVCTTTNKTIVNSCTAACL